VESQGRPWARVETLESGSRSRPERANWAESGAAGEAMDDCSQVRESVRSQAGTWKRQKKARDVRVRRDPWMLVRNA
jgi:hypothetical protein